MHQELHVKILVLSFCGLSNNCSGVPCSNILPSLKKHTKRPKKLMSSEDIKIRKKANDDLQRIFYPGSTKKEIYN